MTARTGLLGVWAPILTALLFALAALFVAGAGAQEAGCRGQVIVDAGHRGPTSGP
jgi:hypothetical protein